ncbi:MAG: MBL fold metallo-hydrolase [Myxococcales bacterium]|nr:MBL fold metallo-hydrolase [Myxococcales bacterium]
MQSEPSAAPARPVRRVLRIVLRVVPALLLLLAVGLAVAGCQGFGQLTVGSRRDRMRQSRQWHGGRFANPEPLKNDWLGAISGSFHRSPYADPQAPIPTVKNASQQLASPPASGLRVTWLGHSTTLVEIDGQRILTDPIFSDRAGPIHFLGPRRWFPSPIALSELPSIDAVVISHDHYDHLDHRTILALIRSTAVFVVPLGVGAHLAFWGVPESRIVELDWWEATSIGALRIVATPARHASGRMLIDDDAKLWAGYALLGPQHRVYYSGDTGLFPAMRDIGARLGPFDLTMIEVGQYGPAWPDWHIGPEQAVMAHRLVRGRVLLPVHWGAFALAFHGWTEPIERTLIAAAAAGVSVVAPRPGQSFEPAQPPAVERWWPSLPFQTAAQAPIHSTQVESLYRELAPQAPRPSTTPQAPQPSITP